MNVNAMPKPRPPLQSTTLGASNGRWERISPAAPFTSILLRSVLLVGVVAIAYIVLARLSLTFAFLGSNVSPLWFPSGLGVWVVFRRGWTGALGCAAGAIVVNLGTGNALLPAALISFGNTLEILAASFALRAGAFSGSFLRVGEILRYFAFVVTGAPVIAAGIGVATLVATGALPWDSADEAFVVWWVGDAFGVLLLASVLFAFERRPGSTFAFPGRLGESVALAFGLGLVWWLVFHNSEPIAFLVFPFLGWAALRFGQRGATAATLATACVACGFSTLGQGPFVGSAVPTVFLALFLGTSGLGSMLLATIAPLERDNVELQKRLDERRVQEELLRAANDRFLKATEIIKAVVWEWDRKTGHVERSQGLLDVVGFAPNECPATSEWWNGRIHPDDRIRLWENMAGRPLGTRGFVSEYRILHKDGTWRHVLERGIVEWDGDQPVRLFGCTEDITARKSIEEKLSGALRQTAEANETKSRFLANISHELRTPLGAVIGWSELLAGPMVSESERLEATRAIRRNGDLLLTLINDILDLTKIEANLLTVETVDVTLFDLLRDVESALGLFAREKGITFGLAIAPGVPRRVRTDPMRLKQILLNLGGNAVKFTSRGEVAMRVENGEGTTLRVTISDTGPGVEPSLVPRLFEPFVQAEASTTRRFGGSGLGLSISKRLAGLLGGDLVLARSELEKGSTFLLTIDPGEPLSSEPPRPAQEEGGTLSGANILLVDDTTDLRKITSRFLELAGARVYEAEGGKEALDLAARQSVDIALVDIQMPGMDGYEVLAELRRRGFARPVVAFTAHAMREERDKCLRAGFVAAISKPVTREDLTATLARLLGRSAGAGAKRTEAGHSMPSSGPGRALVEARDPSASTGAPASSPQPVSGSCSGTAQGAMVPEGGPTPTRAPRTLSTLAHDPEIAPLVQAFLRRLASRRDTILEARRAGRVDQVLRLCHQLRGASGTFGFPEIEASLLSLETAVKEGRPDEELGPAFARFVAAAGDALGTS